MVRLLVVDGGIVVVVAVVVDVVAADVGGGDVNGAGVGNRKGRLPVDMLSYDDD